MSSMPQNNDSSTTAASLRSTQLFRYRTMRKAWNANDRSTTFRNDYRDPGRERALHARRTREINVLRSVANGLAPRFSTTSYSREARRTALHSSDALKVAAPGARPQTCPPPRSNSRLQYFRTVKEIQSKQPRHGRSGTILKEVFNPGTTTIKSENGIAEAERFYSVARPFGGSPGLYQPSKTNIYGKRYDLR